MIKLYLDDIRTPEAIDFVIVRSFEEAKDFVLNFGLPDFISFDHDLGMITVCKSITTKNYEAKTGYDFAKWLVESDLDGIINIPNTFTFNVHSANPVGAKNIKSLLDNYLNVKFT